MSNPSPQPADKLPTRADWLAFRLVRIIAAYCIGPTPGHQYQSFSQNIDNSHDQQ